ncbi:Phenylacetate-coenzyme A ligase [Planctomycetes bacterium Pan216]|uniref:Phenylacetate-coenzyme A ligase n=1 Tax=Kolteria novifilia TaxID=2527975 RepID=A0A518BCH1_9BACT|nr:Phenylacetate-coenzyme A ligase [Planctomycetes bacterium Pan216]
MTREQLRALQWQKLSTGLDRLFASNAFYREKFARSGIAREDIKGWDDFQRLPFTTKKELAADQEANPIYGTNLTEPRDSYVRLHQTSGTTGRRLRWLDTPESWGWILKCWEQIYDAVGIDANDRFFFPFSFGPFIGFWAAFEGASRIGRFVLPGGGLTTNARLQLMLDNGITIVLATPTYALRMAEVAEEEGIDLAHSKVRGLILAGEPGANIPATRQRLEQAWGARLYDHSGMTEIGSIGIEYDELPGHLVLLEDQVIAEVLDPRTLQPVEDGELGELVLTTLGRWGSPLIRYRTADAVRPSWQFRPGGKPFVALDGGILGRIDDMIWVKGNNVYPSAIEGLVREFDEVAEFAIEARELSSGTRLVICIEPKPSVANGPALLASIARMIQDRFYFRPDVVLAEEPLPRFELKGRRFRRVHVDG